MDIGRAQNDREREATYRFLNDEISSQHAELMEWARGIDTKATLFAGFAAAAITFLLQNPRQIVWVASIVFYGLALTVSIAALWPRKWEALKPTALEENLADGAPVFVVGKVAGSKVQIYERNFGKVQAKVQFWVGSAILLGLAVILSIWTTMNEMPR